MSWASAFLYVGLAWAGIFLLLVLLVASALWRLVRRTEDARQRLRPARGPSR